MKLSGSCICQNIKFGLEISFAMETFSPRTCDCDFCLKNKMSYISDTNGKADIQINNPTLIKLIQQGHKQAHFLTCHVCQSVICALYSEDKKTYAAFNTELIFNKDHFAEPLSVSPKKLTAKEKVDRWKSLWFSEVNFHSVVKDFYHEGQFMVFTEMYHLKRGHCCDSGCRHCPYKEKV